MEVKCWNCEEEIEEGCIGKIEGNIVCEECYFQYREEQREDTEADYPDTVRERYELFGGQ